MGKDINGNELGRGFTQRSDKLYCARKQMDDISICLYDPNIAVINYNIKMHIFSKIKMYSFSNN